MKRVILPARDDWQAQHRAIGFDYFDLASRDGSMYWSEGVAYEFSLKEIERLEDASNELHAMCLDVVADLVKRGNYPDYFHLPRAAIACIEDSWRKQSPMLYGRFDFAYDGQNIKMLEYNADTPTGLLEASVAQWHWLEQVAHIPNRNQFNSIHEALIARWQQLYVQGQHVHFTACQTAGREDWGNLEYLMDTAFQAGLNVHELSIENMGWDERNFVDLAEQPISHLFKLYPWEWLWQEEFSAFIRPDVDINWIEPCWKMLLSNKAILVELWQRHPHHPLLSETHVYDSKENYQGKWARKPILSREGANIHIVQNNLDCGAASGSFHFAEYDQAGYVMQRWVKTPLHDGMLPTLGLWMVGDECHGMSLREDVFDVIGNDAHFAAHYFVE